MSQCRMVTTLRPKRWYLFRVMHDVFWKQSFVPEALQHVRRQKHRNSPVRRAAQRRLWKSYSQRDRRLWSLGVKKNRNMIGPKTRKKYKWKHQLDKESPDTNIALCEQLTNNWQIANKRNWLRTSDPFTYCQLVTFSSRTSIGHGRKIAPAPQL